LLIRASDAIHRPRSMCAGLESTRRRREGFPEMSIRKAMDENIRYRDLPGYPIGRMDGGDPRGT
jgi:hypothetical protein